MATLEIHLRALGVMGHASRIYSSHSRVPRTPALLLANCDFIESRNGLRMASTVRQKLKPKTILRVSGIGGINRTFNDSRREPHCFDRRMRVRVAIERRPILGLVGANGSRAKDIK